MAMPSASKFVTKFMSLRRPQYIGLRSKYHDPRGIPVRIWAWDDDDGVHIRVEADLHGTELVNEDTGFRSHEVRLHVVNQQVVESDEEELHGAMGGDNTDIFLEG